MKIEEFDFHVDLLKAILWQYNDAINLQSILEKKQDWYNINQEEFWNSWVTDVFNLQTCNDFGCSVWAIILGVNFTTVFEPTEPVPSFGFGSFNKNFFSSNFGSSYQNQVTLNLTQKRLVLRLRYYQLIARGTVPEANRFLQYIFEDQGTVAVKDLYDMSFAVFIFFFVPSSQTMFVLQNYDVLPRPAGVGFEIQIDSGRIGFGFGEFNKNFFSSNFAA